MFNDDEVDKAFQSMIREWNIAERRIKKAEHVRAGEIVASAIFELRYAGRKVVDALHILGESDWKADAEKRSTVLAYLADATEDCVKSKHDAIDSMLDFVTRWFHETEKSLNLGKIIIFFPDYVEIVSKISEIQDKIADSRQNRIASRDGIYDDIENNYLDDIMSLFTKMKISHERVTQEILREKIKDNFMLWATIGSAIFGVVGIIIAIAK